MVLAASIFETPRAFVVLGLYAFFSAAAFVAYARDKAAAKRGSWRTPESTLHVMSLLGGWPGALMAQRVLRHKSRKVSFQIVFWATVVLNCVGLVWLLSPTGSNVLRSINLSAPEESLPIIRPR